MKPIIAPTDFSAVSLNAVNYAADMAAMLGLHLNLLHVYAIPVAVSEVPVPVFNADELDAEARNKLEELRDKLLTRTGGRIAINTEVRAGSVLPEIIAYSAKTKPYAVVMGAETTTPVERIFFGGKTVEALKMLEWPLIVVPPGVVFRNIRKVGFACDFREVLESVRVKEIKDVVEEFKAELHVLHVSEESGDSFSPETVEESAWLQEILRDLNPKYHFINDPEIEKGLQEFAEKNGLDLLIVIPKKHSLIDKIFQHRHSKRLVLHTHVPVLAIHE
jgi:nucleotide-binding universal stress UspA family protein